MSYPDNYTVYVACDPWTYAPWDEPYTDREQLNAEERCDIHHIKGFVEALLALATRAGQWEPNTGLGQDAQAALVNALDDAMADLTQARNRLEGRE